MHVKKILVAMCGVPFAMAYGACGGAESPKAVGLGAALQAQTVADVDALLAAARDLQAAAPVPADRGWDATADAASLLATKEAWKRARIAYEHVEGVIAPLFPDVDATLDERYDGFMETLQPDGDATPFDAEGIVGMHAIERILFAREIRANVINHEQSSYKDKGYRPAVWPATHDEALQFRDQLCAQLIRDVERLRAVWTPQNLDAQGAYDGLEGLITEQREKVVNAASSQEESRYANVTLADIRANLVGLERAFAVFEVEIAKHPESATTLAAIHAGFQRLRVLYTQFPGDSVPEAPATFSAETPSPADLQSDFGKLWSGVRAEVDLNNPDALLRRVQEARKWALGL